MQAELVELHRSLGMTFIYITHSQEEALTMSDRIVLMRKGRIEQSGTPDDLFDRPTNRFAAEFMGFENVLECKVVAKLSGNELAVGHCHPHVVAAIAKQAATLNTHTRYRLDLHSQRHTERPGHSQGRVRSGQVSPVNAMSAPPRYSRLVSGSQARAVLRRSFAQSLQAIGPSLGPQGRGVLHEISATATGVTHGGFAIAKQITAQNGATSIAPRLIKETMWEVKRDLGDGTTRFACIAEAVFAQASISVAQGVHPGALGRAIQSIAQHLPAQLTALRCAQPDASVIARSACSDEEVANAMAGLALYLNDEGALDIKEGLQPGVEIEQHVGFCFDANPDIIGLAPEERGVRLELDDVHVLVVNEVLPARAPG